MSTRFPTYPVEHVALLSAGAAILLLCMARANLIGRRPEWPVALRLEPLAEQHVDELIPEVISADLRENIIHASGGNPLFITEMVAMARETGGDVVVPPTLQALLAARRVDDLEAGPRQAAVDQPGEAGVVVDIQQCRHRWFHVAAGGT